MVQKITEIYQEHTEEKLSKELTLREVDYLLENGLLSELDDFAFFSLVNQGRNLADFYVLLQKATTVQKITKRPVLVHLRVGDVSRESLPKFIDTVDNMQLRNFLLVSGDKRVNPDGFSSVEELLIAIKKASDGRICLAATVDPGRADASIKAKKRLTAGADFLISQILFEIQPMVELRERLRQEGIDKENVLVPGVLEKPSLGQLAWLQEHLQMKIPRTFQQQPKKSLAGLKQSLVENGFLGQHLFSVPEKND